MEVISCFPVTVCDSPLILMSDCFHDQTIRHQLPQIFHDKTLHPVFGLDGVQLTVATVAGHHHHGCAGGLNLLHFFSAVKHPFGMVAGRKGSTSAAAAILTVPRRVGIHPIVDALAHDPPGLIVVSVPENPFGFSAVITGIVISGRDAAESGFVEADSAFPDVCRQEIEYGIGAKGFQCFGIPFFETRPGRQIGVPSFRP